MVTTCRSLNLVELLLQVVCPMKPRVLGSHVVFLELVVLVPQSGPLSLFALSRRMLKDLLGARTSFSFYVLRCILGQRGIREGPATTALFPIPLPVMDVWSGPNGLGVVRRRRLAQKRLLSLVIMALNYIHSPDPWKAFKTLWRRPSKIHLDAHRRLMALVKAGGPSQTFDFLRCGRKSFQLGCKT